MITSDLKCNVKSIRITDKVAEYIEGFKGDNFNSKLENLVLYCMDNEKRIASSISTLEKQRETMISDIERLSSEREGLYQERKVLFEQVKDLQDTRNQIDSIVKNIASLQQKFIGETIELKKHEVSKRLQEEGFVPEKKIVEKMYKLNELTGHEHNLKDIKKAYQGNIYDGDTKKLLEDIVKELKMQEMARIPVPE